MVAMFFPPDRKQVGDRLSATVARLHFAHTLGWIMTAQRQQRVPDPLAPLLETAER
jgi:hypothetical protein